MQSTDKATSLKPVTCKFETSSTVTCPSTTDSPYSLYNQHKSLYLTESFKAFHEGLEVIVIGFFKSATSNLLDGDGKIFSNIENSWEEVLNFIASFEDYEIMSLKSKGSSSVH